MGVRAGESFGVTSTSGLQTMLRSLAVVYGLGTVSDYLLSAKHQALLVSISGVLALALTSLALLHCRRPFATGVRAQLAGGIAVVAALSTTAHVVLLRSPLHLTFVVLVVVGAGAVLPSRPWLLATSGIALVGVAGGAGAGRLPAADLPLLLVGVGFAVLLGLTLQSLMNGGRTQVAILTEMLAEHARRDDLTGLLNRRGLAVGLDAMLAGVPATARLGVLCLDIDGFKPVNDELGHAPGDAVLIEIAEQLHELVGPQALLCRSGDDEFTVVLPGRSASSLERLRHQVGMRLRGEVGALSLPWSVSVGAASGPPGRADGAAARRRHRHVQRQADPQGQRRPRPAR